MTHRKTERKTGPPGFTGRGLISNNSISISFGKKLLVVQYLQNAIIALSELYRYNSTVVLDRTII